MGGYSGTSNLDLGKKVGNLDFWDWGGYSGTSDLDLGKKVENLEFWEGGGYSGKVMEKKKTYFTEKLT